MWQIKKPWTLRHLPGTQEILQVCLPGHSLQNYGCSFRAFIGPTNVLQMYRSGSITAENSRSQSVSLSGRSSPLLSIMAASGERQEACVSFEMFRFQDKRDKKLPSAHTGNSLSRPQTELRSVSSVSVRGAHKVNLLYGQFMRNHHILIRSDNTTTVAYINRQGGSRSPQLHSLAQKLIVWGRKHFHSLRAAHVPGIMNVGWISCPGWILVMENGHSTLR